MYSQIFLLYLIGAFVAPICARRKIVGGDPATVDRVPYLVSIREDDSHYCGGAIIGPKTILTAGHCIATDYTKMTIRAGSSFRSRGGVLVRVSGWQRLPCYKRKNAVCDLAVLFLKSNFTYNDNIQPIELYNKPLRRKSRGTIAGWGTIRENGALPKQIQITTVLVTPQRRCRRAYPSLKRSQFCAGIARGGKDSCQGDSGGPLVIEGKVAGIISDGAGCGQRGFPGIYTRVPTFKKWVLRNSVRRG